MIQRVSLPPEVLADPRLQARLINHIVIRDAGYETPCWESTYARHETGYTRMSVSGLPRRVHRVAYELWVGPIPPDKVLDHLCRNIICCNPDHLEAVTQPENISRGTSPAAFATLGTHCKNGHEYTPENTYRNHKKPNRSCKKCRAERSKARSKRVPATRTISRRDYKVRTVLHGSCPCGCTWRWSGLTENAESGERMIRESSCMCATEVKSA